MKKLFSPPILAAVLGTAAGLSLGIFWYWKAASVLVAQAATKKPEPAHAAKSGTWDFWSIEIDNLSAELKDERAQMRKESEKIDQRSARLDAERMELDKLRGDLERMQKEISDKVVEIRSDELKNLRTLAQAYTNLSPRAAVAIFRELDDGTAVKILSLMKSDVVGPIFEEMTKTSGPDGTLARRAALLSEKLRMMKATRSAAS